MVFRIHSLFYFMAFSFILFSCSTQQDEEKVVNEREIVYSYHDDFENGLQDF